VAKPRRGVANAEAITHLKMNDFFEPEKSGASVGDSVVLLRSCDHAADDSD
jgi:hypothetical protein